MNVLLVQSQIKHYRVPFFVKLHNALKSEGTTLRVAYGDAVGVEAEKVDNVDLPEPLGVKVKNYWFGNGRLLFQPLLKEVAKADLVIVEQANKHLLNLLLLPLSLMRLKKVAYMGHGRNRHSPGPLSEWWKRRTLNSVDWWFAYTDGVSSYLAEQGISPRKITSFQNAIDTSEFRSQLTLVSDIEVAQLRQELNLNGSCVIGLFVGGLIKEKKIGVLLDAATRIREVFSDFHLIIVGAGPEVSKVRIAAETNAWIHYVGPKFGQEKAKYYRVSDIFMNPGLIGLGVLDAFTARLPVCTTSIPIHSPEIEYVRHGYNGLVASPDPPDYSKAVVQLISDKVELAKLKDAAEQSSKVFTIDEMVLRFRTGISKCLGSINGEGRVDADHTHQGSFLQP
jgi:L-malate glycosyltransferase